MPSHGPGPRQDEIQIAVFCASEWEYDTVSLLFDDSWNDRSELYGRIGQHNAVASISNIGSDTASAGDLDLLSSYTGLKLVFFVDAGTGKRTVGKREVGLGDVFINNIVIQNGKLRLPGTVGDRQINDSYGLIQVVKTEGGRKLLKDSIAGHLQGLQTKASEEDYEQDYLPPTATHDQISIDSNEHKQPWWNSGTDGFQASSHRPVQDPPIVKKQKADAKNSPRVFFVPFDQLDFKLPSFEDSISGDEIPGLFVRGISGFADSQHKDFDEWQPFSAATAAATTKALLERCVLTSPSCSKDTPANIQPSASRVKPAATTDAYQMTNNFGTQNYGVQAGSIGEISGFTFGRRGNS